MQAAQPLPLDRIWTRGVRDGECLIWTGATVRSYGVITQSRVVRYVHRIAWELTNGPIATGLVVMHKCDRPPCFEPEHLALGTQGDNLNDAATKARTSWGEGRPNRKVSLADVIEMRRLAADEGLNGRQLAERFPLGERTIRKILTRRNWKHV